MNLKGWVYDEQGNPVSGAVVQVLDYSGDLLASTTSGSDGSWLLTGLPERPVRVKISSSSLVRWVEGGARIVVQEATVETLKVLSTVLFPSDSLPGSALQDDSVQKIKLHPATPLLERIQVGSDELFFSRGDSLSFAGEGGIGVRLSSHTVVIATDPLIFWSPYRFLIG